MRFVLYRSNLSLTSGAGQLIRAQAEALRAAGEDAWVACRRGGLKFRLRTRLPVIRTSPDRLSQRARVSGECIVDHGMEIREARLIFVHNLMTEAVRHLPREDWAQQAEREREFFRDLRPEAPIVANSRLVERALVAHFGISASRVHVLHPGVDIERFLASARGTASAAARRALGIDSAAPVLGFVTSGDLEKRGLDIFFEIAERILAAKAEARFLVVGARRLPQWAARHALVRHRLLIYRPKSTQPQKAFAALDVFLYPARFDEFGMVVVEALAAGLPVLTSRRVGASECLPAEYARWVLDAPEPAAFAKKALALLDEPEARASLGATGAESAAQHDLAIYGRRSVELMRDAVR